MALLNDSGHQEGRGKLPGVVQNGRFLLEGGARKFLTKGLFQSRPLSLGRQKQQDKPGVLPGRLPHLPLGDREGPHGRFTGNPTKKIPTKTIFLENIKSAIRLYIKPPCRDLA